jgi:hypothetical protein
MLSLALTDKVTRLPLLITESIVGLIQETKGAIVSVLTGVVLGIGVGVDMEVGVGVGVGVEVAVVPPYSRAPMSTIPTTFRTFPGFAASPASMPGELLLRAKSAINMFANEGGRALLLWVPAFGLSSLFPLAA